jgi:undecaprenyl-diphosphatase
MTWLEDAERIDHAIYGAVATTPTPSLDSAMRRLSSAADHSKLSMASAVVLAVVGGRRGRRAAKTGLASVVMTSAIVNLAVKPLGRRRRPEPPEDHAPARKLDIPTSRSFPSGHTAAAVSFATGVGREAPLAAVPLHLLAATVGYSRVHTGVHFPGDVVAGGVIGAVIADLTSAVLQRRTR